MAESSSKVLRIRNVSHTYSSGETQTQVLSDISFEVNEGERVAITGPSGSGKTTLLGLAAGLEIPTTGDVDLLGHSIKDASSDEMAHLRGEKIGFIFQNFQLIPSLTALENVMLPRELIDGKDASHAAEELLTSVGLGHRLTHLPSQLSGGEQQRVAMARAFINTPHILFADEPTGNLDGENSRRVIDLLFGHNRVNSPTLILVTHDPDLANSCDRTIVLKDGEINSDTRGR